MPQTGPNGGHIPDDIRGIWDHRPQPGPSGGAASAHIPRSIVAFPPEVVPPPEAVMFQPYGTANTVGAGTQSVLWTFIVPKSSVLVIKSIDLYATNTTTASSIAFSLLQNAAPYGQYGSIMLFSGVAAVNARSFNEQTFRFPEGVTVSLVCTNNDGAAYTVAAGAQGWYYPKTIAELYAMQFGQGYL
jgi:hypothetical protein